MRKRVGRSIFTSIHTNSRLKSNLVTPNQQTKTFNPLISFLVKIQNRKHNQTKKHDRTSNGDDKCSCEVVTVTFKETTDFYPMHMRVPISTDDSDGCSSTIGREQ